MENLVIAKAREDTVSFPRIHSPWVSSGGSSERGLELRERGLEGVTVTGLGCGDRISQLRERHALGEWLLHSPVLCKVGPVTHCHPHPENSSKVKSPRTCLPPRVGAHPPALPPPPTGLHHTSLEAEAAP